MEIWANAFGTALVGKPEPQSTVRLGPSGDHRLSQVSTRDGECANNGSPSDNE
jgi:hypothetical protein